MLSIEYHLFNMYGPTTKIAGKGTCLVSDNKVSETYHPLVESGAILEKVGVCFSRDKAITGIPGVSNFRSKPQPIAVILTYNY